MTTSFTIFLVALLLCGCTAFGALALRHPTVHRHASVLQSPKAAANVSGKPMAVVHSPLTNVVKLAWLRETNFFGMSNIFQLTLQASTNLTTWYVKTNLSLFATNVTVKNVGPCEFYRLGWTWK